MSSQATPFLTGGEKRDDLALPRNYYDASLLFRCMDLLQIDREALAKEDPLLFRELQGVCALCCRKAECIADLSRRLDDTGIENWSAYCPNAATLTMIGALQNCGYAAQFLRMPRSTDCGGSISQS